MHAVVRIIVASLCIAFWSGAGARATERPKPMPGGFTFGMSKAEILKIGVDVADSEMGSNGETLWVRSLPRPISDFSYAVLSMGFDDQLTQVTLFSRLKKDDKFGFWVIERYETIARILEELYGPGDIMVKPLSGYMARPENFSLAIESGEGFMAGGWIASGVAIYLSVGAREGDTFYSIRYSDSALADKLKAEVERRDTKGF